MSQMRAATGADGFRALHKERIVGAVSNRALSDRLPKAGPARAAIIFRAAFEKRGIAAHTMICALRFTVPIRAGKGPLSARFAGDVKLLIAQLFAPFGFGSLNRPHCIVFFPTHFLRPIRTRV